MDNLFWRGVLPPGLKGSYDFVHPDPPLFCFPPHATVSPSTSLKGHVYPSSPPARSPPIDRNIRPISAFVSYAFARGGNERFSIADSFAIRNVISLIRNKILTNLPRGIFTTKGRKMMEEREDLFRRFDEREWLDTFFFLRRDPLLRSVRDSYVRRKRMN